MYLICIANYYCVTTALNWIYFDTYSQVVSLSYESLFPFANVINACRNRPLEVDCSYPSELFTEPPQLLQTWESSVGVLTQIT